MSAKTSSTGVMLAFLLAGCGPALVRDVNTVPVPVVKREKCIAAEDLKAPPSTHMPKAGTGDHVQKADGAAADVIELDAYAKWADPILRQCAASKE